jgi:uncharacterized membrane protein YfcA
MISSISNFIQFCLLGRVNFNYAPFFGAISFCATLVGIKFTNSYIRKSGRQSIILIFLLSALTFAFFSLPVKMVKNYFDDFHNLKDMAWYDIAKKISTLAAKSADYPFEN